MARLCDQLHAFADGELPAGEADAFRAHLGECDACQQALLGRMQLDALAGEAAQQQQEGAAVLSLAAARRRRRTILYVAAPALAAAAVLAVYVGMRGRGGGDQVALRDDGVPVALAPTRSFEPRLSWKDADRHRPYDVPRAGGPAREDISNKTLAALEDRKDPAALAGAYLLMGDAARAKAALEPLACTDEPASPDVNSDRAALALATGDAARALQLADAALEVKPDHAQALWNRALALRELGLPLASAGAFDTVAALKEPGWSEEAASRRDLLRANAEVAQQRMQAAMAAGQALLAGGAVPPADVVASYPGMLRLYFYHAVRMAPTRARLEELAPLAVALDERTGGGHVLQEMVAHAEAADWKLRAPLAAQYGALKTGGGFLGDPAAVDKLIKGARRAGHGADDIQLGALIMGGQAGLRVAETTTLVQAARDPWFTPMLGYWQAQATSDTTVRMKLLRDALAGCTVDFRCQQIEFELAETLLVYLHRPAEAREFAQAALARVRRLGDWQQESAIIRWFAQAAEFHSDFALARAYLTEGLARLSLGADAPDVCVEQRFLYLKLAKLEIQQLHMSDAMHAARLLPRCGGTLPADAALDAAWALADLRSQLTPAELGQLRKDLADLRAGATLTPGDEAIADYIEGRALSATDRKSGEALLRKALAGAARPGVDELAARRTRTHAYGTLIVLAGAAGEYEPALALFAEEAGLPVPATCALGVAVDDDQQLAVARDANGRVLGVYGKRSGARIDVAKLVPAQLVEALRPCPTIAVLARPPVHGLELLPPDLAWSFVSAATPGAGAPATTRLVVSDTHPPAALELAPLTPWQGDAGGAPTIVLSGDQATPARVLTEMRHAGEIELNAHGLAGTPGSDAALLALSPGADGEYALGAREVAAAHLEGHPLVILAACETTETAPYFHESWSLPVAFLSAGARAVLAATAPISDAEAGRFFDGIRARVRAGQPLAAAARDERMQYLAKDAKSWAGHVLVFEAVSGNGNH